MSTTSKPQAGSPRSARPGHQAGVQDAPQIEFRAVTKRYPGQRGKRGQRGQRSQGGTLAVSSFSAQVACGTTTVLLGSSGCGKTTLLRMVNRMVEPTSGQVLVDGADVAGADAVSLRRSIGYVMQSAGLLPHRSVIDNITLVPRLNHEDRDQARSRALELMDVLGLRRDLAGRYPHQLSGGQAQRVGVARALAADPGVLLMDEPFGAVDPLVRRELQQELARLQRELGRTVLFITHDVDEAMALGDEIILLREEAQVAQQGSPAELLASPADDFVARFLGLDDADRRLRLEERAGQKVVLDEAGRVLGRLEPDGSGAGGAARSLGQAGRRAEHTGGCAAEQPARVAP